MDPETLNALERYVRRRVRNAADADDVLQDALLRIHAGLPGAENPAAWVFGVARRAVADHHRRRKGLPLEADVASPPEPAGPAPCAEPMAERLPEADRELLRLAEVEGVPHAELAARLGLSLTAAKSRVARARGRLKDALLECCRVELDGRGVPVDFVPRAGKCGSCG